MSIKEFKDIIHAYYHLHKRPMPWRDIEDPYKVLVSEIMLQQTQVPRVLVKYSEFIHAFPTFQALHAASLKDVLSAWQGMGYNRRAKYLKEIAGVIMKEYNGALPHNPEILVKLPGIGRATAGSLAAFAYNRPTVFIETNIRRVFIHFFFNDKENVSDLDIYPLVEQSLDHDNPRQWYYALMDYGSMLVKQVGNPNKKSKHYAKQSPFEGSNRQIRGKIIKILIDHGTMLYDDLIDKIQLDNPQAERVLEQMRKEGLITHDKNRYQLPE